jgi:DNA modification methylase
VKPYYRSKGITIYHGDSRDVLTAPADIVVTSPPYANQRNYGAVIPDWTAMMNGVFAALQTKPCEIAAKRLIAADKAKAAA